MPSFKYKNSIPNKKVIIELYKSGLSQNEIHDKFKYTNLNIKKALDTYCPNRGKRLKISDVRAEKIARVLEIFNSKWWDNGQIAKETGLSITYVSNITASNQRTFRGSFTRDNAMTLIKVPLDAYSNNEMDYGTIKPQYNYEELKHEYNLSDKEPTIFGARNNNEV